MRMRNSTSRTTSTAHYPSVRARMAQGREPWAPAMVSAYFGICVMRASSEDERTSVASLSLSRPMPCRIRRGRGFAVRDPQGYVQYPEQADRGGCGRAQHFPGPAATSVALITTLPPDRAEPRGLAGKKLGGASRTDPGSRQHMQRQRHKVA